MKITTLSNAFTYTGDEPKNHVRANIYLLNEKLSEEDEKALLGVISEIDDNGADRDIAYEIVSKACDVITDKHDQELNDKQLTLDTIAETMDGFASVYTGTRLSYLNHWNQSEISDLLKDFNIDIADACAYWYDNQVHQASTLLLELIDTE